MLLFCDPRKDELNVVGEDSLLAYGEYDDWIWVDLESVGGLGIMQEFSYWVTLKQTGTP